ncbi:hypothetical protein P7K49_004446 [Saguinus oedipus]|uniref:Uncharacterized protein n=1 Tax=Saguinus oedipus TaxID=9490 RepID=A0ABQ9W7G1_SAGOE|nr:hypothetical protein P7K49_004446 [Saguinus oedipus]
MWGSSTAAGPQTGQRPVRRGKRGGTSLEEACIPNPKSRAGGAPRGLPSSFASEVLSTSARLQGTNALGLGTGGRGCGVEPPRPGLQADARRCCAAAGAGLKRRRGAAGAKLQRRRRGWGAIAETQAGRRPQP